MNIESKSLDVHWITAINDYERKKIYKFSTV